MKLPDDQVSRFNELRDSGLTDREAAEKIWAEFLPAEGREAVKITYDASLDSPAIYEDS